MKHGSLLGELGFSDTAILDRNELFADFSRILVDQIDGSGYSNIVAKLGQEGTDDLLAQAQAIVSAQGQLRSGPIQAANLHKH